MLAGVGVTGSYLLAVVTPEIEGSWGGNILLPVLKPTFINL